MDKYRAWEVWEHLADGKSLYALENEGNISQRTGQRLKTVKDGFEAGSSLPDIAKSSGLSEKRVNQLRGWFEQYRTQRMAFQPNGDPLLIDSIRRHRGGLWRVMALIKEYLEQVAGEIPSLELQPWRLPPMDTKRLKDLFSHLAKPDLDRAFQQATSDVPSDGRTDAGRLALELLREVLTTHHIPGSCDHCLPDRAATIA